MRLRGTAVTDTAGLGRGVKGGTGKEETGMSESGPGLRVLTLQDSRPPGAHLQGHHRILRCRFPTPFIGHTRG